MDMGSLESKPRFKTLYTFKPEYSPKEVTQYESETTGMRVVVVNQEGPKVLGFFVLATEIHDDSGSPHTLEHLCFMGSKSYQYKGFLDKLATRAYSNTNAWTSTDLTAYQLETAGWTGFAQILPVYLEHIIVPTLTDAGCLTEVHHIDGSGNDAGVVYSEMQGVENIAESLIDLKAKRIIYPEGNGLRYETGGMLERLRVLTPDRIRAFHREMYQPKNLCLILCGEVNHDELLEILSNFESSILEDIPSPDAPFKRPWVESKQTPPISKTIVETVEFPEEDESFGKIEIRFLGPDYADIVLIGALNIALLYLAGSSAALLDNTLVEKEQLASSVSYAVDHKSKTEINFYLSSIATEKLVEVEQRFFEVLREAMAKPLDMSFMQDCIERHVRTEKFDAEGSNSFVNYVLTDYVYGKRDGPSLESAISLSLYDRELSGWDQEKWRMFIKTYISDAKHVSLLGIPSAALSENLKNDEAARIEKQKKHLGPDGLLRMLEKLENAKEENDREIPAEILGKFKVPSTESIHFPLIPSARIGPALKSGRPQNKYQKIVEADGTDMPLFLDFEHIPSNFARINLIISTETLPLELRPMLSIYLEAFFSLPMKHDGQIIDFERVVVGLERDTVSYDIGNAAGLGNVECLRIAFEIEVEKYKVAIKWIKELLWNSIFDPERVQAINNRLLADISDSKRDGSDMLSATHLMIHLAPKSIGRARNTLVKAVYLKRIKQLLKTNPELVVKQLNTLRDTLCTPANFRVLVIADLEKLDQPVSSWSSFLAGQDTSQPLNSLGSRLERLSAAGLNPGQLAYVIPMAPIDSSFAQATARGPTSFDDPLIPALMVAMSYMNAVEGPLWVAVRGTGLAYGTNMNYDIWSGYIHLEVYRSPDAFKAFEASRKVVEAHMDGTTPFDPLMLEGAISSIVVDFANAQETLASAAQASFVQQMMKGLPSNHQEIILKKVREVGVEEIKEGLKNLVFDMFTPGKADVIVTCAPGLKEGIKEGLESAGFKPEIKDLTFFQDDYGLKVGEGGDEDDDEDEDEDVEDEDDFEVVGRVSEEE